MAESDLEDLFFPEELASSEASQNPNVGEAAFKQVSLDTMMAESLSETQDMYRPNTASYDSPKMEHAPVVHEKPLALDTLSLFTGKGLHSVCVRFPYVYEQVKRSSLHISVHYPG
jgi:peroxisome-assembly ATPase